MSLLKMMSMFKKEDFEKEIRPGLSLQTFLVFAMMAHKELKASIDAGNFKIVSIDEIEGGAREVKLFIPSAIVAKWQEAMGEVKSAH